MPWLTVTARWKTRYVKPENKTLEVVARKSTTALSGQLWRLTSALARIQISTRYNLIRRQEIKAAGRPKPPISALTGLIELEERDWCNRRARDFRFESRFRNSLYFEILARDKKLAIKSAQISLSAIGQLRKIVSPHTDNELSWILMRLKKTRTKHGDGTVLGQTATRSPW